MRHEVDDLGREIERALAVDPSPEFTARVRTGIAREPEPSSWRLSWMFTVAGIAVAAIVLAMIVMRPEHTSGPAPTIARTVTPAPPSTVARGSTGSPRAGEGHPDVVSAPVKPARPEPVEGRAAIAAAALEPEILIDPREAMALQRLIAGVRDGRVDLSPVLRATTPTAMELPPVADLVIAPLIIELLAPVEGAEGVRQ